MIWKLFRVTQQWLVVQGSGFRGLALLAPAANSGAVLLLYSAAGSGTQTAESWPGLQEAGSSLGSSTKQAGLGVWGLGFEVGQNPT